MAEGEYRRLAAACHCGEPVKLWSGRGRKPLYCQSHTGPPTDRPAVRQQKQCPACRGIFISAKADQVYCTRTCGYRMRRGCKPRDEVRQYSCAHCAKAFESTHSKPMYCSKACKVAAWWKANPGRPKPKQQKQPRRMSAYFAAQCERCGRAEGHRRPWSVCSHCKRTDKLHAGRTAARALNEAKHKAAGKVAACDECLLAFCPLYGCKLGPVPLCSPCAEKRCKAQSRVTKALRRARERGVLCEAVNPLKVFERDGWRCRLCGVGTPKRLRGTAHPDAPELDHADPLSRGGAHTYANTQCLCRACNGRKGAMTMVEVVASLGW